ncbi:hypothetical protein LPB67_05555 [Undibacterium sp. Jales W-56]|uniref:hypothetical protein n=1 Tax=Undibacterium sp. Jales W-56 TaxID=2897325 RepID=UPI0021D36B1F|nr:hypothetical protein [Undibacterium sp. Jales W-56]MCU6433242.1 hypothetical protein [Undibacterium sp. Jales W-56]
MTKTSHHMGAKIQRKGKRGTAPWRLILNEPASWVRLLARNASESRIQPAGVMYVVVSSLTFCLTFIN